MSTTALLDLIKDVFKTWKFKNFDFSNCLNNVILKIEIIRKTIFGPVIRPWVECIGENGGNKSLVTLSV